jgi:hypothetical protein
VGSEPLGDLVTFDLVHQVRRVAESARVFPRVIGSGKRPFSEGTIPAGLKLVDSTVSTTGVVIGTYRPAGRLVTGSFVQK